MTLPRPGEERALADGEKRSAAGEANCSDGYSCLYEHANWDGRRLQFFTCRYENLSDYGFQDQTSSWHNNQNTKASVVENFLALGIYEPLWTAQPKTASSQVADAQNEKADRLLVC
nr:peptidase inhibitor family I36 protein [Kineosporia babensis]